MQLKCFPARVEIYNTETGDHVATVSAFDESSAELDFKSLFGRADFDDTMQAIRDAVWMVTEPVSGADKTGD